MFQVFSSHVAPITQFRFFIPHFSSEVATRFQCFLSNSHSNFQFLGFFKCTHFISPQLWPLSLRAARWTASTETSLLWGHAWLCSSRVHLFHLAGALSLLFDHVKNTAPQTLQFLPLVPVFCLITFIYWAWVVQVQRARSEDGLRNRRLAGLSCLS